MVLEAKPALKESVASQARMVPREKMVPRAREVL
jgi:hypothetical protein